MHGNLDNNTPPITELVYTCATYFTNSQFIYVYRKCLKGGGGTKNCVHKHNFNNLRGASAPPLPIPPRPLK